jgi:hypothetical protein
MENDMQRQSIAVFVKYILVAQALLLLCSCSTTDKTIAVSKSDCSLQVQNSVTLQATRYVSILEALKKGTAEQAVQDMDWWIDQAIIELISLEENNPDGKLEENPVVGTDGILRYKRLYRDVARYRAAHPRTHKVPLDSQQLKIIDTFVNKYK